MNEKYEKFKLIYLLGVITCTAFFLIHTISVNADSENMQYRYNIDEGISRSDFSEYTNNSNVYFLLTSQEPNTVTFVNKPDWVFNMSQWFNTIHCTYANGEAQTQQYPIYAIKVSGSYNHKINVNNPDSDYYYHYENAYIFISKQNFSLFNYNTQALYDSETGYYYRYISQTNNGNQEGYKSEGWGYLNTVNCDYYVYDSIDRASNNDPIVYPNLENYSIHIERDFVGYCPIAQSTLNQNSLYYGGMWDYGYFDCSKYVVGDEGVPQKASDFLYDLPVLKNLRVAHTESMGRFEFNILWDIPSELAEMTDIIKHAEVEVMSSSVYEYRPQPWSNPTDINVDMHKITREDDDYNSERFYVTDRSFKYDASSDLDVQTAIANARNVSLSISNSTSFVDRVGTNMIKKKAYPTFWIRVIYHPTLMQSGDKIHCSNWVKLEDVGSCVGYVANEISGLRQDNIEDEFTPEVINSNSDYDGQTDVIIDNDDDYRVYLNNDDIYVPSSSAWGLLQRIIADVKDFPTFFATFFSFLPVQFGSMISLLIIIVLAIGVYRKLTHV